MRQHTPAPTFPAPEKAGPHGLLMTGGSLAPHWMLAAYRRGIFPMPVETAEQTVLAWFSPDPRGVLELDQLHVSRRLTRRMRRGEFQFTCDQAFAQVVAGCAPARSADDGCWITAAMQRAYLALHREGVAHSVEAWQDGALVGGIFGVAIGGFFAGESMFHRTTDASKAALAHLVTHLRCRGCRLFDVQWTNDHTCSLGARDIPRREYLARLRAAVDLPLRW